MSLPSQNGGKKILIVNTRVRNQYFYIPHHCPSFFFSGLHSTHFILKIPLNLHVCFSNRDNFLRMLLESHPLCLIFIFTVIQKSRVIYLSPLTI